MSQPRASFKTWTDYVDPAIYNATPPTERKRQHANLEFISTEEAFVGDLEVLLREYEQGVISPEDTKSPLFRPMQELLSISSAFLADLKAHQKENAFVVKSVGPLFLKHFSKLDLIFLQYPQVQRAIEEETDRQKLDPKTSSWVRQALLAASQNCGGMDLNSYLLKPFQRMTRYPLLLKEITKHTTEPADKANIEHAYQRSIRMVKTCNEKKRDQELQETYAMLLKTAYATDDAMGKNSAMGKSGLSVQDLPKLLGATQGVKALFCETLSVGSLTKDRRKSSRKIKLEASKADLTQSGGVIRETLYDNNKRTLLLLRDPIAGPFLIVMHQCTTSYTAKGGKVMDPSSERYVVGSQRIPVGDLSVEVCNPFSDKKKLTGSESRLAGLKLRFMTPWRVAPGDKNLKDAEEEIVLKVKSAEAAGRMVAVFDTHAAKHQDRIITRSDLDAILRFSTATVPHREGSEGQKLQIAAGMVKKLVQDVQELNYKLQVGGGVSPRKSSLPFSPEIESSFSLRGPGRMSFKKQNTPPTRSMLEDGNHSGDKDDGAGWNPRLSVEKDTNPLSPSDTMERALSLRRMRSSEDQGTVGPFQPRRLSSFGGYEASTSGTSEPVTPFFTPSAIVSSPKSIPNTPLQNKRFTLTRASSAGIAVARMSEETAATEGKAGAETSSNMTIERQEQLFEHLKEQDQEFNTYINDLHVRIQALEGQLDRQISVADTFRHLTKQRDGLTEQLQQQTADLLTRQEITVRQQHEQVAGLFVALQIDPTGMLASASTSIKLRALNKLAAGGQLILTEAARAAPAVSAAMVEELAAVRKECASLRAAAAAAAGVAEADRDVEPTPTVPDVGDFGSSIVQDNIELRQKVKVVQGELTEMTLQVRRKRGGGGRGAEGERTEEEVWVW